MRHPLKKIVSKSCDSHPYSQTNHNGIGAHTRRSLRWTVTLECGHKTMLSLAKGRKQKRVRCWQCDDGPSIEQQVRDQSA